MQFTATILMLATAITGAIAAPGALEQRQDTIEIKACDAQSLKGTCSKITIQTQHDCFNLVDKPIFDNVHSVSIPSGYRCRFWSSEHCNGGGTGDIQSPGSDKISSNTVGSVKCYIN
ncbi:hypothetical protein AbraIFM66951_004783 [Aspergillus brasiliensis]|uniref:Uncharacterized protein n=2 Tax=Aspergillus brasiliensis TaxID=319629 RepID=A0A1L9UA10_ASPBC|nr:hypothetical protein ASPBRDRAFT_198840 [Aspergillus brasiliensis CBS 101740]GKZ17481.1 hypothetical protein AbraCBS73388_008406 [Aspergillus brasiliensis]GKZ33181.1 hypothetical protein AbraIFM66950_002970 [Aspergillus brasiliensis]GKZ43537.1 hypothetical protein AbraIFM66951_004783 [Aspergillus brasiliensis]